MNSYRLYLVSITLLCVIATMMIPTITISAQDGSSTLQTIDSQRNPVPGPHTNAADNHQIYNDLIVPGLPTQSREADIRDDGHAQRTPGSGIRQAPVGVGEGITLYKSANTCNDFNKHNKWKSQENSPNSVWSDSYGGWGPFAKHDGVFYNASNVVFSLEQNIGPGNKFSSHQYSIKIASGQPYAAGIGSPMISASPGTTVTASVKYMIFDHDTHGQDYDWASLGLKPDAEGNVATYKNGYKRGEWAEITHSIVAGESGKIMVLIQAHSPAALNSNIYFDDIKIAIDGKYLSDCTYESRVKSASSTN